VASERRGHLGRDRDAALDDERGPAMGHLGAGVEPACQGGQPVVRHRRRCAGGADTDGRQAIGEGSMGEHGQDMAASSSMTVALPRGPTSMAGPTQAGQPSVHGQEPTASRQARSSSSTSVKSRSVRPTPPGVAS
jgi:hypothetical protein